ncbi:hypothetical protein NC653_030842 [Populus alba x Populus x berolinensis]|uniref:Uncharacterized protein n=1 Tax=Populus alba x Populus x berolinensis TaxID=444605 RepID=A0AAD6Q1X6_9ROSI|nr:hypothetical protein NC653_030842 [Populus alba x Populus x berolinensis]
MIRQIILCSFRFCSFFEGFLYVESPLRFYCSSLLSFFSSFYGFSAPGFLLLYNRQCSFFRKPRLFQSSIFFYSPAIQLCCLYTYHFRTYWESY